METPNNKAGITINNLLTSTSDEATPTFCEGSKLSVKVKNALTNEAVEGVMATILRLENGEEQVGTVTLQPSVGDCQRSFPRCQW